LASQYNSEVKRSFTGTSRPATQIPRSGNALAQFVRLHAASRLRISGRRFLHRASPPPLLRRTSIPQSSSKRNRLVDFLGPPRRRAHQEPAGGYLPAPFTHAPAARIQTPPPQ